MFVNKQADPNKKLMITTLKAAVRKNEIEQIRYSLTTYGLPKSGTKTTDYSILQLAMKSDKTEIAILLINAGCRLTPIANETGYTPLALAVQNKNEQVGTLLLQKGCNLDVGDIGDDSGLTVLHLAAKQKSVKMLKILLNSQISINYIRNDGIPFKLFLRNCVNINENQNMEIVRLFLAKQSPINFKTIDDRTVLHYVVKTKQIDIIKCALQATNDVNEQNRNKNTALHLLLSESTSADENILEIVELFVSKKAKISIQNNIGDTVCHIAAKKKFFQILEILLQYRYDVNCCNHKGNTILHYLCQDTMDNSENEDLQIAKIVEVCIKKGATVDIRDRNLKTPLYWAVLMRQKHSVKTLLEFGADPNLLDDQGGTIVENLMKQNVEIITKEAPNAREFGIHCLVPLQHGYIHNLENPSIAKKTIPPGIQRDSEIAQMLLSKNAIAENVSNGQLSIFHYCAAKSYLEMLFKIITYSNDPNIRDSHQDTIIHTLLINNLNTNDDMEKKLVEIVAILLSKGADINAVNEKNETLLHLAAKGKHFQLSKNLLQLEANVTDLDNHGNTVLHFLCMLESQISNEIEEGLTELFLNKGCDINAQNNNGMTPLLFAAQSNATNMIKILIEQKAKIDCFENENSSMAIHLATENNYQGVIQQLIDSGVDVNIRRRDRKTALHLSVSHNLPKATKFLLEKGADTDLKDTEGKTPLHWACWYESLDSVNELLEYGSDVNIEDNTRVTPLMLTQKSTNIWPKLRYHLVKLGAANMPVSERNKRYIEKCIRKYANYAYESEATILQSAAIEEILKMEKVPIAPRTSLADVLLMSASKLSVFQNNEDFQKLLNSHDFKEMCPMYADLVRACYRRGIIRSDLIVSAKGAFRKILGLPLPDTCCDAIFHYLDNENLNNLEKAAEIKIMKRKRVADKIDSNNEDRPAKRVRRYSV